MTGETKKKMHDELFEIHMEIEMARRAKNKEKLLELQKRLEEVKKKYVRMELAEREIIDTKEEGMKL